MGQSVGRIGLQGRALVRFSPGKRGAIEMFPKAFHTQRVVRRGNASEPQFLGKCECNCFVTSIIDCMEIVALTGLRIENG